MRDETFGNARLSRNLFERTINNQANRIITIANLTQDTLTTIEASDIPGELELQSIDISTPRKLSEKAKIRKSIIEAINQDPRNPELWFQLSEVVDEPQQVIDCLERVQRLDPSKEIAKQRLKRIKQN
jgi:hypothetical protein